MGRVSTEKRNTFHIGEGGGGHQRVHFWMIQTMFKKRRKIGTKISQQNVTFFKAVFKIHFRPLWIIFVKQSLRQKKGGCRGPYLGKLSKLKNCIFREAFKKKKTKKVDKCQLRSDPLPPSFLKKLTNNFSCLFWN